MEHWRLLFSDAKIGQIWVYHVARVPREETRMVLIRVIADQEISDFDSVDVDASMVRKAGQAEPTQAWSRLTEMVQHNFSASFI